MRTILSISRDSSVPNPHNRPHSLGLPAAALFALLGTATAGPAAQPAATEQNLTLQSPAHRIISLAPHVTELLYAAGAGSALVGAVEHSDYPPEANRLPRVGTYDHPNVEAILRLEPDLVVAWHSGTPPIVTERLRQLHVPVFVSRPLALDDIPEEILRLGKLAGTVETAQVAASRYRERTAQLAQTYAHRPTVRTFYEVWNEPLVSIGGQQILDSVLRLCGGQNVFGKLPLPAPTVSIEAVLAEDPEVILASGMGEQQPQWLDEWRKWQQLQATRLGNLYFVPPDILQRPTPRILDGAQQVCTRLEEARHKRAKSP